MVRLCFVLLLFTGQEVLLLLLSTCLSVCLFRTVYLKVDHQIFRFYPPLFFFQFSCWLLMACCWTKKKEIACYKKNCCGFLNHQVSSHLPHGAALVAQVLADVHGEGAGAAAEADALRAVLPPVAGLAEEGLLVLAAVGRLQAFVAQVCPKWVRERKRVIMIDGQF